MNSTDTTSRAAEIQAQIDTLSNRIALGVTQITTDGTTTSYNLDAMKSERARLERQLSTLVQPVSATADLSHG